MKKKQLISILLICLVCILPILCVLMFHHITLCNTIQRMGGGTFGKSACLVSLSENSLSTRESMYESFIEQNASVAIYMDDTFHESYTVRYMAFTDEYVTLPMIKGRFFNAHDFKRDQNVAVVGKSISGLYEENGKEYIDVNGVAYQVLGVLGYEETTEFDNYILLNMFSCEEEDLNLYTLDFFEIEDYEEAVGNCMQDLNGNSDESVAGEACEMQVLSVTEQFQDTLSVNFDVASYFVGLLFCYIMCILLISYQWILVQKREVGIRRLLGASQNQITKSLIFRYLCYLLLSFVVGFAYCKIGYLSYLVSFYKGFVLSAVILLAFIVVAVMKLRNDSIEEVIK